MIRNQTQILTDLKNSLNSSAWQQLKGSLLGRELLAYGTEIIFSTELVKEALGNSLYLENVDIDGIISISNAQDIPLQKIKPATVKVVINSLTTTYYAPFTLKFTKGAISFTNIDYVSSDGIIELYQGNVVSAFSNASQTTADFLAFKVDTTKQWTEFTEFVEGDFYSKYIKLGNNAMAASVRILEKSGSVVIPITEYNPLISDNLQSLYKVRNLRIKYLTQ